MIEHGERVEPSFVEVVRLIRDARYKTLQTVNTQLIELYWQVGEYISQKVNAADWGDGVVKQLAEYIATELPEVKGFTHRNLFRMKQFYEAYQGNEKVSALLTQLPWTHNMIILSKCKHAEEREFYLNIAIQERYSSRNLEKQIHSSLFERVVLNPTITSATLRQLHPLATQAFKDTYLLDFLNLPDRHSESDLQKSLATNIKNFLMELGRDFCFVGEQYKIQVGGKDFYLDLLFYHRGLTCLVAFELKVDEFQPEHLGKLSFYLEALDRDVKKQHEKPSVGVLLCKYHDAEIVEYALSRTLSPALVAEYQTRLPDKELLQRKLHEFYEIQRELLERKKEEEE